MKERVNALILGGGLTGLAAAHYLHRGGVDDVIVIERDAVPGGLMRTNRSDGLTIDHLPHLFFSKDQAACDLFRELVPDHTTHGSRLGIR
jgi:protoporphyrinogen oxidase